MRNQVTGKPIEQIMVSEQKKSTAPSTGYQQIVQSCITADPLSIPDPEMRVMW